MTPSAQKPAAKTSAAAEVEKLKKAFEQLKKQVVTKDELPELLSQVRKGELK